MHLSGTESMMIDHKAHLWLPGPEAALSAPSCLYCEVHRHSMTSNPLLLQLPVKAAQYPLLIQCSISVMEVLVASFFSTFQPNQLLFLSFI